MDRPYLHLPCYRISDLACPTGLLTANQWDNTIIRYASYSRKSDAWIDERQRERPIIIGDIPTAFKRAIDAPAPPFKEGDIVLAVDKASHAERYARFKASSDGGPDTLTELWTDTTGYPHETGKTLRIADQKDITHVALWTGINKHYKQPFAGDDDETPEERAAIIGPVTSAFPLCDGWHTLDQTVRKKSRNHPPRRLSDLSIHEMTTTLTARITRDVRPNCEANWTSRWYRPIDSLNWMSVWQSLGTPLSDPTEEKTWRRLLHRAIDAKNRHNDLPDHDCRLLCGEPNESMLHMLRCPHVRPYWHACVSFATTVLNAKPHTIDPIEAAAFNVDYKLNLLNEASRAFFRHAVRWWYAALTRVHKEGAAFVWQSTFYTTLTKFREAVTRYAVQIRRHYIQRKHTNLTAIVPASQRTRFNTLITIQLDGTYTLTDALTQAIQDAKLAHETRVAAAPP